MRRTVGLLGVILVLLLTGHIPAGTQTAKVVPKGKLVLAWHTTMASKWLDPQEHDGTATPDNFLNALHDALIKNYRETLFDHPGLAERYEFAPDAKSATFWLRPGITFHNGEPVTAEDVQFSFEHYRGAKADVLKAKTERIEIIDARTVRFHFKEPFLDFPMIFGTSNVSGAGWIVPAKYYQQVGPDGFKQKPIGAGPYKLVRQEPGTRLELEAFEEYYRPVHVKQLVMIAVPEGTTRVAMLERGEADLIYGVPGELIERVQKNPTLMLAPVLSASW
jgi:peptide/nickel transport system substrate-binding protein